ncbi:MAG: penicillin-binding transpeptidase domain-containing protein [Clostridia bacterium]
MKKTLSITILLTLLYLFALYSVYIISTNSSYAEIVSSQSSSKISIYSARGTIYDCNLQKITNTDKEILAVAMPVSENFEDITSNINMSYEDILSSNTPIVYTASSRGSSDFIDYFNVFSKYSNNLIAQHIVGYTDSLNTGVTGIELACDDILSENQGELILSYNTNALGQIIVGTDREYENTINEEVQGVALTIDSDIQIFAQEVCQNMEKGSVVICDIETGEIKASVSMPSYDPSDLTEYLDDEDSPMINRSFLSYAPGSVFKLLMASYALENNISEDYYCTGSIEIDGKTFVCNNSTAHGDTNLHLALQKSCNCYFINLAQQFDMEEVLNLAILMGFGLETEFYTDYSSSSGNLPSTDDLVSSRSVANFSIGQGTVMTTPIQIAQMINCIANDGYFQKASLYLGEVNSLTEIEYYTSNSSSYQAISVSTANTIQSYMESTATYGTARDASPDTGICGIKTGTAQTGVYDDDGNELVNHWYAGYVGNGEAEYSIVVLSEGVVKEDSNSAEIFKEIAEFLVNNY